MEKMRFVAIYKRFKCTIQIIVRGHLMAWGSRERRRQIRQSVTARFIPEYFKMYLPEDNFADTTVIRDDANEKIFALWLQGEENAPPLVKACFDSIKRHCSLPLVVIDNDTIENYIQLPDYIVKKRKNGNIGHAHYADIVRVELLYKYGGYWLDATCYTTSDIPQWIRQQDFFMYQTGEKFGSPYSFTQNCFIRSRKGAYLLAVWRSMIHKFWRYESSNYDYFMHQLLFKTLVTNHKKAMAKYKEMEHVAQDPTHILWQDYRNAPYSDELFRELTKDAFFQKTTYRGGAFVENSFGDVMVRRPL